MSEGDEAAVASSTWNTRPMKTLHIFAVLASLSCSALGCAVEDAPADSAGESQEALTTKLTDLDAGNTVSLNQGDDLQVVLSSNATTGYAWQVARIDPRLGKPTINYLPSGTGVGSGGKTSLVWKTGSVASGLYDVALEYRRSWESASVPANRSFSFKVRIGVPVRTCTAARGVCVAVSPSSCVGGTFVSPTEASCGTGVGVGCCVRPSSPPPSNACEGAGGRCVGLSPVSCASGKWGRASDCGTGIGVGCCLPR